MINASGFKVWPAEVEALMFRHPAGALQGLTAHQGRAAVACRVTIRRDLLVQSPDTVT